MKVKTVAEIAFWSSLASICYPYFGYPLILWAIGWLRRCSVQRAEIQPSVSLIITVHNEEPLIQQKLENTLALSYPREYFEVIVASDGSTDKTEEIARQYALQGVQLVAQKERKGKEAAQRLAVAAARGEILVFTDAAVMLQTDAIQSIVRNFADPSVGCVSSEDGILNASDETSGEDLYIRYEMWLRRLETQANSLVGLSGSFFAVRREVCRDWSDRFASDFYLLLSAVRHGYRGISDPICIGYYRAVSSAEKEFPRKVRTVLRGMTVFFATRDVMNPIRYGFFSWQVISHKLLRWSVPIFLSLLLIANIFLLNHTFYQVIFLLQALFYGAAWMGYKYNNLQKWFLIKVPSFFLVVNLSIIIAWRHYFTGRQQILWQPTRRS
jgi:cellulose synthase/poly-beta-1,6-N-acetylglucosamine synthase-like glycosyltransferase